MLTYLHIFIKIVFLGGKISVARATVFTFLEISFMCVLIEVS